MLSFEYNKPYFSFSWLAAFLSKLGNHLCRLLFQCSADFVVFRKSSHCLFGVNFLFINKNFKTAIIEGDERELTDALLVVGQ